MCPLSLQPAANKISAQEAVTSVEEASSVESAVEAPAPTATEAVVEAAAPPVEEPEPTSDAIFSAFETARSPEEGSQPALQMATPRPTAAARVLKPNSLVQVSVAGFPANAAVTVGIGQVGKEPFIIDESITNDQGVATVVVAVPANALNGQEWTVTIATQDIEPPVSATAVPFVIGK